MQAFRLQKKTRKYAMLFPVVSFLIVFFIICHAIFSMKQDTLDYQRERIEKNIYQATIECFVLEGRYPSSLSYIEEEYGFTYDEDRFFVDYRAIAENIMPDITVIAIGS